MGIKNTFIKIFDNERYIRVETLYGTAKEMHSRGFALFNSIYNMIDLPDDFDYKEYVGKKIDIIKRYDEVLNQYDVIRESWEVGLVYFANERKIHMPDHIGIIDEKSLYSLKEQIVNNYQIIKEYNLIVRKYRLIKSSYFEGLNRFVRIYPSPYVYETIDFMKYVNSNERTIKSFDYVIKKYDQLLSNRKEAIRLFLNIKGVVQVDYSIKEKVISNERRINQIHQTLSEYKSTKALCPNAVKFYLSEHAPDLQSFVFIKNHREVFQTAEIFYRKVSERLKSKLFLFDLSEKDLTSVSLDNHNAKKDFHDYIATKTVSYNDPVFSMPNDVNVFFDIIQSPLFPKIQRKEETLADLCNIAKIANQNTYTLSSGLSLIIGKEDAILGFYKENGIHDSLSFSSIIDYFSDKRLKDYLDLYEKEKGIRNQASHIANYYSKGFKACFPAAMYWGTEWTIGQCMDVINKEKIIIQKNGEIEAAERRQQEQEERERIERQRRQREAESNRLLSKISHWYTNKYGIKHMWMYAYLPTSSDIYADEDEWDVRNLIWAFKNNPSKPARHYTYSEAMNRIVDNAVLILQKDFGSDLNKITLVCVPSSNRTINERRFETFSDELCKRTGMTNAFSKIEIIEEAVPRRDGGTGDPVLRFDKTFFKDRYILIFDDITTTGRSVALIKQKMNELGAKTLGALTIGKTIHEHVSEDPISIYKRFYS